MKRILLIISIAFMIQVQVFAGGPGEIIFFVLPLENAAVSYILDASLVAMGLNSNYWGSFIGSATLPIALYQYNSKLFDANSFWEGAFKVIAFQLLGGYLGHEIIRL